MKKWQKIEDATVATTGMIIEKTDNPVVHLVMEIIQRDSQMHYRLQEWIAHQEKYLEGLCPQSPAVQPAEGETEPTQPGLQKVFDHYLLLPLYAWGVADWDLDSVRRIILDEHPTVGFTLEEARLAKRVPVFEAKPGSMHEVARNLSKAGCDVELIDSSGTRIASMDDREIRLEKL